MVIKRRRASAGPMSVLATSREQRASVRRRRIASGFGGRLSARSGMGVRRKMLTKVLINFGEFAMAAAMSTECLDNLCVMASN